MSAYSFPFLKSSKGIESSVISTNGVHSESLAALSFIIRPINAEIAIRDNDLLSFLAYDMEIKDVQLLTISLTTV